MISFAVVAAMDEDRGIGCGGTLPWRLARDMEHFRSLTLAAPAGGGMNAVIMGRRTWESLPERFRPLPGRINVVLTSRTGMPLPEGVMAAESLDKALADLGRRPDLGSVFVIGGGMVYAQALEHPACHDLHLTFVQGRFRCDTFFPEIPDRFRLLRESPPVEEGGVRMAFRHYRIGG